jgi:hypothetical protein
MHRPPVLLLGVTVLAVLAAAGPAGAELVLPPGFSTEIYVGGAGFEVAEGRAGRGIPSVSTMAFDEQGALYLARTGRRYVSGEVDDLFAVYRIPLGGVRLTPATESRYFYGPPLRNPQVATMRGGRELFVSTFDRDRQIGVLYQMLAGRAEMFAGGTPAAGQPPLLKQPEGAAADAAGNLYVADRGHGVIVRLDPAGRVLNPRWITVSRPRVLQMDEQGQLWVGGDGNAEAPWQRGPGEVWKVTPDGKATLMVRGIMPAAMALGPGGQLVVADRAAGKIYLVGPEGKKVEFMTFTDGDAPRGMCFAPVTAETRRAGIAGALFVSTILRGAWPVNEVLRVTGPLEEFARRHGLIPP